MTVPNYTEDELKEIARKLISNFSDVPIWCFVGEMGAGKTTLIKQICRELGVMDQMSSPTFSIVNEYLSAKKESLYHFDLYRLKDLNEALDIGVEDYLYSSHRCLIEWPELIESVLPENYLKINIKLVGDNARSLTAQPV